MRVGGKAFGTLVIVLTVIIAVYATIYTRQLEAQRQQTIAQLATIPGPQHCTYDGTTCPQADAKVVLPDATGVGIFLLGIVLGAYLIMSDGTQRKILAELEHKREQVKKEERREIVMSVLTQDEQRIVKAVIEQPGISQATLRLRTDMSKAKLSMLLKDLERRGLIAKTEDGKTNTVHLKREL